MVIITLPPSVVRAYASHDVKEGNHLLHYGIPPHCDLAFNMHEGDGLHEISDIIRS